MNKKELLQCQAQLRMISLVQWFFQQDDYERYEKKNKTISSRKTFRGETAVTERQTGTDRQKQRQTETDRDRQTDRQTDRQRQTDRDRQTEKDRQ